MITLNIVKIGLNHIVGEITERNKYYINVRIIHPYSGWDNGVAIGGPGRMNPNHFLTDRGTEVAKELLNESYKKLKMIDKGLDKIVNDYYELIDDIEKLDEISDKKTRHNLKWKLEEWFWCHRLFHSNQTGLIASYSDRKNLEEIFRVYRTTGKKVFLSGVNLGNI